MLLDRNGQSGIDGHKTEFFDHGVVLFQQLALEDSERLLPVVGEAHVLACFVKLDIFPARADPVHGYIERHLEIETEGWLDRKGIYTPQPVAIDAPSRVPGESRVDVPVGEHDRAGLERREYLGVNPAGEVGGVNQAE